MSEQQIIGSYRLETPQSQGTASAWRARHLVNGELFLLRKWNYDLEQSAYVERMKKTANLRHGNVRPILEFGLDTPGNAWSITQIPRGVRISEQLKSQGVPPSRAGLELVFGVSCALEAAHAAGIYHGHLSTDEVYWENGRIVVDGWGAVWETEDGLNRDLSALRQLTTAVLSEVPDSIRALVDAPPRSVGAFRRAFANALSVKSSEPRPLLPQQAQVEEDESVFDDRTVETGAHLSGLELNADSSTSNSLSSGVGNRSSKDLIDPQAMTAEHTWDSVALQDSWGLGLNPEEDAGTWLDGTREEIRDSNRYRPEHEEDWGITATAAANRGQVERADELPSGMRIHTVSTQRDGELPGEPETVSPLWQWVIGLILLAGVGVYLAQDEPEMPPPAEDLAEESNEVRPVPAVAPSPGTPDAATKKVTQASPNVLVTFAPVAVNVTRISDGVEVCTESRECALPIDIDYQATHPDYEPSRISGDDLYDRRQLGRMRIVLKAKQSAIKSRAKPR